MAAAILETTRLDQFSVRVPSLDLVPQLKTILERQPYEKLAANVPLALGAIWYRINGGYQGDDLLAFLLVEMYLALRAAAQRPLERLAEQVVGLPLHLSHFEDDVIANRTSPLAAELPPRLQQLVAKARVAFPAAYRGGITLVTNRSKALGAQVHRCVPTTKNGHSYRVTDPFDLGDAEPAASLTGYECKDMMHRSDSAARISDPTSATQMPSNHSMVRANRDFYYPKAHIIKSHNTANLAAHSRSHEATHKLQHGHGKPSSRASKPKGR